ncbi:Sugar phosphatase YbiV [compost metagenome]
MIKLVVTDLDGTFLNNSGTFDMSLFNEVYGEVQEQGVAFVACTGKQCERVEELFGEHGRGVWILGDSAARIKRDGELVREFTLERQLALQAVGELEKFADDLILIACTSDAAFVSATISEEQYRLVKHSYAEVRKVESFEEATGSYIKLTVFDAAGRSALIRQHVEQTLAEQIYIVDSEPRWVDITARGTHKGETVKKLQDMLGITPEETMSFGDGENDIELMAAAKYSFAVSNACENTKNAASFITKSNEENGVLLTIRKMLELQGGVRV